MRDRLYNLLPVIYRQKDLESKENEPLKAYLDVLETVFDALESDIDRLYHDWFIETCQDRMVPWIGELVGAGISMDDPLLPSYRTYVANTLAYRRRKGTAAILARAVQDLTGWEATVVEFFNRLSMTQSLALQDVNENGIFSIRDVATSEWGDSPFNRFAARTLDIRTPNAGPNARQNTSGMTACAPRIDSEAGLGRTAIGVYIARLRSFPLSCATPYVTTPGCYTFHSLGFDTPLFNLPTTQSSLTATRTEADMSLPLRRTVLEAEWIERDKTGNWSGSGYFGDNPAFRIWIPIGSGKSRPLHSAELSIRDLHRWQRPNGNSPFQAFVDPELGRFTLSTTAEAETIRVSYQYGFASELGSGPYTRQDGASLPITELWTASVCASTSPSSRHPVYASLVEAIEAWQASGRSGRIQILDSASYTVSEAWITLDTRLLSIESVDNQCPCLLGSLSVLGSSNGGAFYLNGCMLEGPLLLGGNLRVSLDHCTIPPHAETRYSLQTLPIYSNSADSLFNIHGLAIQIQNSVLGPIDFNTGEVRLEISDSIVDGAGQLAINANTSLHDEGASAEADVTGAQITASFQRVTILGSAQIDTLESALDSIFTEPLTVTRRNQGFLCFCFVPPASLTPVRYRCQPDLALQGGGDEAEILLKLQPIFSATLYGVPSYAQLGLQCPAEIRAGAENGSEMGAFHRLNPAQRERGLQKALNEYLPYGLDVEVFCMT